MELDLNDRKIIAKRWADGDSAAAIAENLGRSPSTIYAELVFTFQNGTGIEG